MPPQGASSPCLHAILSIFFANLTPSFERNSNNNSNIYELNEYLSTLYFKNLEMSNIFAQQQTCCINSSTFSQT
jgi:hypothetical protein